jgi:hypothetical protein
MRFEVKVYEPESQLDYTLSLPIAELRHFRTVGPVEVFEFPYRKHLLARVLKLLKFLETEFSETDDDDNDDDDNDDVNTGGAGDAKHDASGARVRGRRRRQRISLDLILNVQPNAPYYDNVGFDAEDDAALDKETAAYRRLMRGSPSSLGSSSIHNRHAAAASEEVFVIKRDPDATVIVDDAKSVAEQRLEGLQLKVKEALQDEGSIVKIQALFRGNQGRKLALERRVDIEEEKENGERALRVADETHDILTTKKSNDVTTIQSLFRRKLARRKADALRKAKEEQKKLDQAQQDAQDAKDAKDVEEKEQRDKEEAAATKIQALFRGHRVRKARRRREAAEAKTKAEEAKVFEKKVIGVQSLVRGHIARKKYDKLRTERRRAHRRLKSQLPDTLAEAPEDGGGGGGDDDHGEDVMMDMEDVGDVDDLLAAGASFLAASPTSAAAATAAASESKAPTASAADAEVDPWAHVNLAEVKNEPSDPRCDVCETSFAYVHCNECSMNLCIHGYCDQEVHGGSGPLKHHKRMLLREEKQKKGLRRFESSGDDLTLNTQLDFDETDLIVQTPSSNAGGDTPRRSTPLAAAARAAFDEESGTELKMRVALDVDENDLIVEEI